MVPEKRDTSWLIIVLYMVGESVAFSIAIVQ